MGVDLVEYDIEKDEARKAEMKKLTGGSTMVPVIDVEGIVIRGYAADEIRYAVEKKRKEKR
ncbi:MAG: hypothetical protein HZA15_00345 [Nitrospirae bacterium]|nr:hypothetical protein [Nitrospirota bacterium]